jgi:dihydroorotase-like cyclic amidohydrolase
MASKLGVASQNVVLLDSESPVPALILIENQLIHSVHKATADKSLADLVSEYADWNVSDVGELVVGPGLVDLNVRVNGEWEGYEHATKAAIASGVTFFLETQNVYDLQDSSSD